MNHLSPIYDKNGIGIPFFLKLDFRSKGYGQIEIPAQELAFLYVETGSYSFNIPEDEQNFDVEEGEIFIYLPIYRPGKSFTGLAGAGQKLSIAPGAAVNTAEWGDSIAYIGSCPLGSLGMDGVYPTLPRCSKIRLDEAERSVAGALLQYGVSLINKRPVIKKGVLESVFQLLVLPRLAGYFDDPLPTAIGQVRSRAQTQIERVVAMMRAKIDYEWTLEELAALASMSRSTFIIRFKRAMASPPLEYLTNLRMQKAKDMLASAAYELSEIAETVGYGSESAFCRVFKRTVGQPPIAWQRAHWAALNDSRGASG